MLWMRDHQVCFDMIMYVYLYFMCQCWYFPYSWPVFLPINILQWNLTVCKMLILIDITMCVFVCAFLRANGCVYKCALQSYRP